jgi:hypothetical protein
MFGIIDLASIAVIVASFAIVMYNLRMELKTEI